MAGVNSLAALIKIMDSISTSPAPEFGLRLLSLFSISLVSKESSSNPSSSPMVVSKLVRMLNRLFEYSRHRSIALNLNLLVMLEK